MREKQNSNIGYLNQLLESRGWRLLKQEIDNQVKWCTDKALDPEDETMRETITLTKRELILKWRKYNELLSKLPENLISFYENGEAIEYPSEWDVYPKESEIKVKE